MQENEDTETLSDFPRFFSLLANEEFPPVTIINESRS